jgi:hypothetical protein
MDFYIYLGTLVGMLYLFSSSVDDSIKSIEKTISKINTEYDKNNFKAEVKNREVLYAPWRDNYSPEKQIERTKCVFCEKIKSKNDEQNFIIKRFKNFFIMLNSYPYATGHLLVIPIEHIKTLESLTTQERS